MPNSVEEFVEKAHQSKDLKQVCALFGKTVQHWGFDHWAYQILNPSHEPHRRPLIVGNYPPAWVDYYVSRQYQNVDPVIVHGPKLSLPFAWSSLARAVSG